MFNGCRLKCIDPCEYIFFNNNFCSKLDYFFLDEMLIDEVQLIEFKEDFVIGVDHLPGIVELKLDLPIIRAD